MLSTPYVLFAASLFFHVSRNTLANRTEVFSPCGLDNIRARCGPTDQICSSCQSASNVVAFGISLFAFRARLLSNILSVVKILREIKDENGTVLRGISIES